MGELTREELEAAVAELEQRVIGLEAEIDEARIDSYEDGRSEGHDDGYSEGYDDGYESGQDNPL